MRSKLVWTGILVAVLAALVLTTCRRFPEPGEPIASTTGSIVAAATDGTG